MSDKIELGQIKEIDDIRNVRENEASVFTPWLAKPENISILSKAIDININIDEVEEEKKIKTEVGVGSFSADIVASDLDGRKIIIENQLEETDHRHLGQLITYASGLKAKIIIWIVKESREEHRAAIEWLNNNTNNDIGFFLCEIKLLQIDDSKPAVQFVVIEKPNNWAKQSNKQKAKEVMTKTEQLRLEYWTEFMNYASKNKIFEENNFNLLDPNINATNTFASGAQEYIFNITQQRRSKQLIIHLYVALPFFEFLKSEKEEVESKTGLSFEWRNLDNRGAMDVIKDADLDDINKREEQFEWLITKMCSIKQAFLEYKKKKMFKDNQ